MRLGEPTLGVSVGLWHSPGTCRYLNIRKRLGKWKNWHRRKIRRQHGVLAAKWRKHFKKEEMINCVRQVMRNGAGVGSLDVIGHPERVKGWGWMGKQLEEPRFLRYLALKLSRAMGMCLEGNIGLKEVF